MLTRSLDMHPKAKKSGFSFFNHPTVVIFLAWQSQCSWAWSSSTSCLSGTISRDDFTPPKMHEAEQANLNLGCLDQLEALIVTKNQLQKTKQDAKKRI